MQALHKKFKNRDFVVLAVNAYQESKEEITKFTTMLGLEYTQLNMGMDVAWEQYSVNDYPANFWIGRDGKLIDYSIGPVTQAQLEDKAAELLGN